ENVRHQYCYSCVLPLGCFDDLYLRPNSELADHTCPRDRVLGADPDQDAVHHCSSAPPASMCCERHRFPYDLYINITGCTLRLLSTDLTRIAPCPQRRLLGREDELPAT